MSVLHGVGLAVGEGELLILHILVIVVVREFRALLRRDDTAHEFHGRITLAVIAATVSLDGHLLEMLHRGF